MVLSVKEIYVDGVQLPTPAVDGVTITSNKEWSKNAGRLEQTGSMAGTITAIKRKIEITWPPITMAQAQIIENAVTNLTAFHTVRFCDMAGQDVTMTAYFGTPTYTQHSYGEGNQWVSDVSVSAVEQ